MWYADPRFPCTSPFGNWLAWFGYLLFFMMLFVPTSYQLVKLSLLSMVLMAIGVGSLVRGKLHLHVNILLWTIFMMAVGLAFMTLGALNNAPGALRVGTVYVLWPLVFTFLVAGIDRKNVIDDLFKIMVLALIAISLYSMLYLSYATGYLPAFLYVDLDMGQRIGIHKGYIEFNLYSIASLNFLIPFVVAILLVWPKRVGLPIAKLWLWVACILGILVAILTARRGVWLVLLLSPLVTVVVRMFLARQFRIGTGKKFRRIFLCLMLMLAGFLLFGNQLVGVDPASIWRKFLAGFDFSGAAEGGSLRAEQFFALFDGWQQNPFFGAGHGATASGSIRSVDSPWAYELGYVALLFQTGLVGFLSYSAAVVWVFWMGLKITRSCHWLGMYMLPVLVGTICFLIANASNPYLAKFDYIWIIFLPVALINIWLLDRGKSSHLQSKEL